MPAAIRSLSPTLRCLQRMAQIIETRNRTGAGRMKWKYAVEEPRLASVLALLVATPSPVSERPADALSVLFTVRAKTLRKHAGEVSFPGGAVDSDDASLVAAALRETKEEVGVDSILILGQLPELPDKSLRTRVYPFLGVACSLPLSGLESAQSDPPLFLHDVPESQVHAIRVKSPDELNMTLNHDEVETYFVVPVRELMNPRNQKMKEFRDGAGFQIPSWEGPNKQEIWGLTAYILNDLLKNILTPIFDEGEN
ncbi:NUDIX hydrolase domain-like protein [Chytriomyces sp. MP71]|nr:NUDIX hydrolase domain-like protein [Chytriomyces sp. MP71]